MSMIEQRENQLLISFPTVEAASQALRWMEVAVLPWLPLVSQSASPVGLGSAATSSQPSEPSQETKPAPDPGPTEPLPPPIPASLEPEPSRSRHVVLTPERQDQLYQQRQSGQTAHQRLLRAQTTLRDGVLPFSRPGQPPPPSGQSSPRQKAALEGGFADGAPEPAPRRGSQLRLVARESGPATLLVPLSPAK